MIEKLETKWVSALEKVWAEKAPSGEGVLERHSILKGESFSLQLAYLWEDEGKGRAEISWKAGEGVTISIRRVESVPCAYPAHPSYHDEDYITTKPGVYPDILRELTKNEVPLIVGQWRSLWIEVTAKEEGKGGEYEIELLLKKGEEKERRTFLVEVIDAFLPQLSIPHTEWFHYDGLSNYYGVEMFGKEHFRIIENFIKTAVKRNCNTILTPIFTPPLDTEKGGERKTAQLVEVKWENGEYQFGFEVFRVFVELAKKCGIEYFEISHLFSQWGAENTPKIIVKEEGREVKKFGWHTPATGKEYQDFLNAFLPALIKEIEALEIADRCFFHISDEPTLSQEESYSKAKEMVKKFLKGYPIVDALSNYSFYEKGLVDIPVCATNHIELFLKRRPKKLWAYYCSAQWEKVSNRFIVQEGYRTRILGTQLYQYDIDGFLHWGYNFYNSDLSTESINPYAVTDAAGAFPSGDSFLVYPKKGGEAEESIRLVLMDQAMNDFRAMKLLESLIGKEEVKRIITSKGEVTFSEYPRNVEYLTLLREEINQRIKDEVLG